MIDFGTELKRYSYFFLAPTLIYRDEYVKIRKIRWEVVLKNSVTFLILVFYLWSVFKALCIPIFKHTVDHPGGLR